LFHLRVESDNANGRLRKEFALPGTEGMKLKISSFADLQLSDRLLRAIKDADYHEPTPIQARAIPIILERADLLGIAQTGTGKTAAFTLPLLQNIGADDSRQQSKRRKPRALILAPTRELALQISESVVAYGRYLKLRHSVVMGGVSQGRQVEALRRGVDIVIATPGRLMDLIRQNHVDFTECRCLVLDEADRMLDMGFIRDIRRIVAVLPKERQTMLFSATMPAEIAKLAGEILKEPKRIEVSAPQLAVERIDQQLVHVETSKKRALLSEMLGDPSYKRVIVFARTKRGADRIVGNLGADGIAAVAMHGNKSQNVRQRALKQFNEGTMRVLVATDIASRGIDVPSVSHVINYELPETPESYVHRIGRTARAGAPGTAISFCDGRDRDNLRGIERYMRQTLPLMLEPGKVVAEIAAAHSQTSEKRGAGNRVSRRRRQTRRLAA
jgi:ATP-dependent RNA helicase RhlE